MKKRVDEAAIPVHNAMSRQTHAWGANGKAANSGGSQGGRKGAQKWGWIGVPKDGDKSKEDIPS